MGVDYAKIFAEFTEPAVQGVVLQRVCDIPAQELTWLWPGRIPLGKLALFAGDPGLGKGFVTLDIAARVTCGREWPDGAANGQPGSVIILSAEDDPGDTIRPRLEAAGADLSKVLILQAVRRTNSDGDTSLEQFSLQTDLAALRDALASLNDVRLMVIDPISAYLGSTDSHVNAKVRGLLAPLADLARRLRLAALAVDHLSKANRPALYRPNGSIAFTAAARAVWFFAKSPDEPAQRLMLPGKMNLAPDQQGLSYTLQEHKTGVAIVAWAGPVSMSADVALQPDRLQQRSALLEAEEWLKDRLSSGPVSAKQIQGQARRSGFTYATLRRAKDALRVISDKSKGTFDGGWEWSLAAHSHEGAQNHGLEVNNFDQPAECKTANNDCQHEDAHSSEMSTFEASEPKEQIREQSTVLRPTAAEQTVWPSATLDAEQRFGPHAKLFPYIGHKVNTPAGRGTLVQVFADRVTVVPESEPSRCEHFSPSQIEPIGALRP